MGDRRLRGMNAAAAGAGLEVAMLDAALDCVISIDDDGRVSYFNESASRTFGYAAADAVGRELAELIIRPSDRDAHRRGLTRYLGTGEGPILGRRIELMAIRADGTEFPVELTVTRMRSSDGPGFLGFVRDITERLQAEEDLRSANTRIEQIANEQAALRRVATLVACQIAPEALFEAVAREAAQLLGVRWMGIMRYDDVGGITLVGVCGQAPEFVVGRTWPLDQAVAAGEIWRTRAPVNIDAADFPGSIAQEMQRNGLRFASGVPITVEGRLWGAMTALESDPDALRHEVVTGLQGFTELVAIAVANAVARSELVTARRRVIEAADAARARLTRDIHDGAQQRFVTALINLQLARQKWSEQSVRARELLDVATDEAEAGIETLRELAAGIHPAILADLGLAAALDALTDRAPIPVSLDVGDLQLAPPLRASVYFFCSEALTNVVKHARASSASVRVQAAYGHLEIEVRDDGVGGAAVAGGGSGLVGLQDRIGALEGTMTVTSGPAGTTLAAIIPLVEEDATLSD